MEAGTIATIVATGATIFGGIVSTTAVSFYKIGRLSQRQDDSEKAVEELGKTMESCKLAHAVEHKDMNDRIYTNQREISSIMTATDKLDEWLKRIDAKIDKLGENMIKGGPL